MAELNRANRMVCDVDIRVLKTKMPFLKFDTANTTTAGLSGDSVYAMAKGNRRIAFPNPITGTMTIEAQVYPFKFFSLLSDGTIKNDAIYAENKTIKCTVAGQISFPVVAGQTIEEGTVFVYPSDSFGDESTRIEGQFTQTVSGETQSHTFKSGSFNSSNIFEADTSKIAKDKYYTIGYFVKRTSGVKRISFKSSNLPQDYYITQRTLDKDDEGTYTPFLMTAYKASIQRSFDLSFTSEGDPATVTLTLTI